MHIGVIGLGRMGRIVAERLIDAGHAVSGFDLHEPTRTAVDAETDVLVHDALEDLCGALDPPRRFWLMVPAGDAVDEALAGIEPHLGPDAIVLDGGNSHFAMSLSRARALGCEYLDCGTSGGVAGREIGLSLMVGGPDEAVEAMAPALTAVAGSREGWAHLGPSGAGHYVKMVHNGIEYALMQAYGEGFELLHAGRYDLDLAKVANVWTENAVIRSWLLELCAEAFEAEGNDLVTVDDHVAGGSTGRWTVEEALVQEVPVPLIYTALAERFASRNPRFARQLANRLRHGFGGHPVARVDE
ncbi:MAG: NADP-dependent phosphogluconate dehydrogenase [Halobacteriota archaeon]